MSNYLTGLAQLNPQVKRHNGGTTTLTLDQNGTTNATMLYVNGVGQTPGIDFNVSGATLTTTSTLPAGTNIATTIQYFNTGVVNTVADDAIGLGQMASGTDGNLITYDASGNPAHVATGSDGQVLTSAGAGAAPAFENASGGWTFVSSVTASSSATVAFTGMTTGYDYMITGVAVLPATDNQAFEVELGVTGPTYRTSGYVGASTSVNDAGLSDGVKMSAHNHVDLSPNTQGNATDEEMLFELVIFDPASATDTYYNSSGGNHQSTTTFYAFSSAGHHTTAEAMTAIKFAYASGNIATGIFKLYKRANA